MIKFYSIKNKSIIRESASQSAYSTCMTGFFAAPLKSTSCRLDSWSGSEELCAEGRHDRAAHAQYQYGQPFGAKTKYTYIF